jgi:hypothetical protein
MKQQQQMAMIGNGNSNSMADGDDRLLTNCWKSAMAVVVVVLVHVEPAFFSFHFSNFHMPQALAQPCSQMPELYLYSKAEQCTQHKQRKRKRKRSL